VLLVWVILLLIHTSCVSVLQIKDDFLGRQILHFNFHDQNPETRPLVVGDCTTLWKVKMESSSKVDCLIPETQPPF